MKVRGPLTVQRFRLIAAPVDGPVTLLTVRDQGFCLLSKAALTVPPASPLPKLLGDVLSMLHLWGHCDYVPFDNTRLNQRPVVTAGRQRVLVDRAVVERLQDPVEGINAISVSLLCRPLAVYDC